MVRRSNYSDKELATAIEVSTSWRGVLRELGLASTSTRSINAARNRADVVGLSYDHFAARRGQVEVDISRVIRTSSTWAEVLERLEFREPNSISMVKGHAARLGVDYSHLAAPIDDVNTHSTFIPNMGQLGRAGPMLAAAWFTLCGCDVSWPLEPCRYDLLVDEGKGSRRIQVKTTTVRAGATWKVYLSSSGRARRTYDPEDIDAFFVITSDMNYFLIPVAVVGGLQAIHLAGYEEFRLPGVGA